MTPDHEDDDANADAPDELRAPTAGRLGPDTRRWAKPSRSARTCVRRLEMSWILGSSETSEEPERLRWCQIV
jgi:hypothetical protein